jgi:hypothetical protein
MALKTTGRAISLKSKLLMVGDSGDGLFFFKRREMVTHLSARFYKLARVVRATSPGREGIIWPVDSLILSYQLGVPYWSERCPKKETFLVKASAL